MTRSLRQVLLPLVVLSGLAFRGVGFDASGAPALPPPPPPTGPAPARALGAAGPGEDGPARSTEVVAVATPKKKPGEFLVLPWPRHSEPSSVVSNDSSALPRKQRERTGSGIRQTKDVVKAVKKRLQNKDPKVQFFTLTKMNSIVESSIFDPLSTVPTSPVKLDSFNVESEDLDERPLKKAKNTEANGCDPLSSHSSSSVPESPLVSLKYSEANGFDPLPSHPSSSVPESPLSNPVIHRDRLGRK